MHYRIAFISEHASPLAALGGVDAGGQNVYVGELAKQLASLGYEVDVFTRMDNEKLPLMVNWMPGVRVVHVEAGPAAFVPKEQLLSYMPDFRDSMIKFIRNNNLNYALVHANFFMSAWVASELKDKLHIPFVVTFHALGHVRRIHQGSADQFPADRLQIEEDIVKKADRIIAECPQDKDDLIQHYNAAPERIATIPCGFDPAEFYPIDKQLARMLLNLDANEHIILQLGRMVPRKGIDTVIQALGVLKNTISTLRLVVVGGAQDDPEKDNDPELLRLKCMTKSLGIEARVTFAGRKNRDRLKYYYAAADAFITTPWYEPFGITPLEAMACGTPVIGANVGGVKFSVLDGKTGLLVPPKDPAALAEKIELLLANPRLCNSMGKQAIARVNALFTWAGVARKMSSVYEALLLTKNNNAASKDSMQMIDEAFNGAAQMIKKSSQLLRTHVLATGKCIVQCLRKNNKIMICGNGSSVAQSQQFATALISHFGLSGNKPFAAMALSADMSMLATGSNDTSYDFIYEKQVKAYGRTGDILICIINGGNTRNLVSAMAAARSRGIYCIAMLGKENEEMLPYADIDIMVPSLSRHRVEELHLTIIHTLTTIVEKELCMPHGNSITHLHEATKGLNIAV